MHTLYRILVSSVHALKIVLILTSVGVLVGMGTGQWELAIALFAVSLIFFAPIAFMNTWEDVGD